MKHRQS